MANTRLQEAFVYAVIDGTTIFVAKANIDRHRNAVGNPEVTITFIESMSPSIWDSADEIFLSRESKIF